MSYDLIKTDKLCLRCGAFMLLDPVYEKYWCEKCHYERPQTRAERRRKP